MTELHLTDALRASDVRRWQIVRVLKDQSVAEHSFNVALIALELADRSKVNKGEVLHCAILHDLPEVLTGDIPTPTKKVIGKEKLDEFEKAVSFDGQGIHDFSPDVLRVVKMADRIEACLFLLSFGRGPHARKVLDKLVADMQRDHPMAARLYIELTNEPSTTMDDIANVKT